MRPAPRPRLAVWKFASCDGCQLTLLDCEDELLSIADVVEIASFPEASRAVVGGPYDLSLVEGSVTTSHDAERIHQIRRASKLLVAIGACATAGEHECQIGRVRCDPCVDPVHGHCQETSVWANGSNSSRP